MTSRSMYLALDWHPMAYFFFFLSKLGNQNWQTSHFPNEKNKTKKLHLENLEPEPPPLIILFYLIYVQIETLN